MTFSVGQIVTLKEPEHGVSAGHICEVSHIVDDNHVHLINVKTGNYFLGDFTCSNLAPKSGNPFVVGQEVRLLDYMIGLSVGTEAKVTRLINETHVELKDYEGLFDVTKLASADNFLDSLAAVAVAPAARPLAVGQHVELINSEHSVPAGYKCIVSRIISPAYVQLTNASGSGSRFGGDFLVANLKPIATPVEPFPVGSIVVRTEGSHGGMRVGDTATVVEVRRNGLVLATYGGGHSKGAMRVVSPNLHVYTGDEKPMKTPKVSEGKYVYLVAYSQYAGSEAKMSYLNVPAGELLKFTKRGLQKFLRETGLELSYVRTMEGLEANEVQCVMGNPLREEVRSSLKLSDRVPDFPLNLDSYFDGRESEKYRFLTQKILGPVIPKPIAIEVPHSSTSEEIPEGDFQVKIWSGPHSSVRNVRPPLQLYGEEVYCRDKAYTFTGEGLAIIEDGYCVAELFPNCLYIHHDAVDSGNNASQIIYGRILQAAATLFKATDFETFKADAAARKLRLEEDALRDFASKSIIRVKSRNRAEIAALNTVVKTQRAELFKSERALHILKQGDAAQKTITDQIMDEFKKLREGYAGIQEAKFEGNRLIVITSPLNSHCNRTGDDYHLGRVKLSLPFGEPDDDSDDYDADDDVVFMTTADEHKRLPHTGCATRGVVCLGSAHSEIYGYTANYEMLAAVTFMIAFLETAVDAEDDWGMYINNFPNLGS